MSEYTIEQRAAIQVLNDAAEYLIAAGRAWPDAARPSRWCLSPVSVMMDKRREICLEAAKQSECGDTSLLSLTDCPKCHKFMTHGHVCVNINELHPLPIEGSAFYGPDPLIIGEAPAKDS